MADHEPSSSCHRCYSLVQHFPSRPGVYQMLNEHAKLIYIGKARCLRQRVASYFREQNLVGKTAVLMKQVCDITFIVTQNEHEALLLEANLIKQHKPRYNILLRDDKSYPYLYLDTSHAFPRLDFYRGTRKGRGRYFGPYPNAGAVRELLAWIQKLFRLRQCSSHFYAHRSRPCLQYHIKRCTAPCVGLVTEDDYKLQVQRATLFLTGGRGAVVKLLKERMHAASSVQDYEQAGLYRDQLQQLQQLNSSPTVAGGRGDVDVFALVTTGHYAAINLLMVRSGTVIGQQTFFLKLPLEVAATEILQTFLEQYYLQEERMQALPECVLTTCKIATNCLQKALSQNAKRGPRFIYRARGLQAKWQAMSQENARGALAHHLRKQAVLIDQFKLLQQGLALPNELSLIECFDISHTQGESTVAACVVCNHAGMQRQQYRRFNIQADSITPGDDYAALYQAIKRRYQRQKRENKPLPDLLLIDGGKGQLKQAQQVFQELQISGVWLLGIAKGPARRAGEEVLHLAGAKHPITLAANHAGLHLLQRIRDEAHRFAITGHRAARSKSRLQSVLQEIPGVGPLRRQALLQHFGGIQAVRQADCAELAQVPGISLDLAKKIHAYLRQKDE